MNSIVLIIFVLVFAYIILYFRGRYYLREGYQTFVSGASNQTRQGNYIV